MKARSFVRAPLDSIYHRMGRVLRASGARHGVDVQVDRHTHAIARSSAFVQKAHDWTEAVHTATEPFALFDCDLLIRRPLDYLWNVHFDIAVTVNGDVDTLNSGVIFVRPSDRVREFFDQWPARTALWCARNTLGGKPRYSDQDALIELLRAPHPLCVFYLPMVEWNSTQLTWREGIDRAHILHVKSGARALLEGRNPQPNRYEREVARLWREEESKL